jgi:hypothetical protein
MEGLKGLHPPLLVSVATVGRQWLGIQGSRELNTRGRISSGLVRTCRISSLYGAADEKAGQCKGEDRSTGKHGGSPLVRCDHSHLTHLSHSLARRAVIAVTK